MLSYNSTELPVLLFVSQPSYQPEMHKTATFGLLITARLEQTIRSVDCMCGEIGRLLYVNGH